MVERRSCRLGPWAGLEMLAGEGLRPSSKGVRIDYTGPSPRVVDGPFVEAKELVAGFWILQTRDQDEAVEWLKRAPFAEGQVGIRQIAESGDFGDALTPELREADDRMRGEIERRGGPHSQPAAAFHLTRRFRRVAGHRYERGCADRAVPPASRRCQTPPGRQIRRVPRDRARLLRRT